MAIPYDMEGDYRWWPEEQREPSVVSWRDAYPPGELYRPHGYLTLRGPGDAGAEEEIGHYLEECPGCHSLVDPDPDGKWKCPECGVEFEPAEEQE